MKYRDEFENEGSGATTPRAQQQWEDAQQEQEIIATPSSEAEVEAEEAGMRFPRSNSTQFNPQRFKRNASGVVIPLNARAAAEQAQAKLHDQGEISTNPKTARSNTTPPTIMHSARSSDQSSPATSNNSAQLHEQPPQYDYGQLLEELEKSKPFIPRPNTERESSLGNLIEWGKFVGGKAVFGPISRFMDLFDNGDQRQQTEYMSWSKKQLYRLGGAFFLAWSAFLTQAVTNLVFVDANKVTEAGESFFRQGWFGLFNVTARTFLTALVFTSMLSYFETMIFDENKSALKKWLIVLAFVTDIVINTVGWITLWNHNPHFEWNPFMSLFYARNPHFEWGSLACEIFAVFNAVLPEMCWFKARNAVTSQKKLTALQQHQQQAQLTSRLQQRGMYLKNRQGQDVWVTEEDLRRLAQWQRRQEQ